HGDLAASKPHHGVMGKQRAERLWGDLTNSLNNMTGGFKTMEQWKKTWIDWKNKTKKKQQYNQNHPSGKPKPFSAMEERVLAISCRFSADQHWLYGDQSVESPKSSETVSVIYPKESETKSQTPTIIYQTPSESTSSKTVSVMYQKPSESTSQPGSIKYQKAQETASQSATIICQKTTDSTSPKTASTIYQKPSETTLKLGSIKYQKGQETTSQSGSVIYQKPSENISQSAKIIYQKSSENISQPAEVPIEFEEVLLEELMDDEVIPEADGNSTKHNITGEETLGKNSQSMDTQQSSDLQAESECEMTNEEVTAAESENKIMYLSRIRPTAEQLELLLQYIDRHGDPVHWSRQNGSTAADTVLARRLKADQMWIDLTDALNAIGNRKTIGKWKKTWVDWKSKTKKKLQNSGHENLSSYERRLIAVLARAKKKLEAKSEEQIAAIKEFLVENASESGRGLTPSLDDQPADGVSKT
ncbi:uncharacterized protein LOC114355214, partial [Ostrinia furnacalis]|uniref:uncharacterized protein LOC114355214 n=1 Tax=Ostrinia furnacalis TaxID=93504 RepID=UPI00103F3886